jgi:hypothetical protein
VVDDGLGEAGRLGLLLLSLLTAGLSLSRVCGVIVVSVGVQVVCSLEGREEKEVKEEVGREATSPAASEDFLRGGLVLVFLSRGTADDDDELAAAAVGDLLVGTAILNGSVTRYISPWPSPLTELSPQISRSS